MVCVLDRTVRPSVRTWTLCVPPRVKKNIQVHSKDINRLTLNKDRTLLLTCSKDYTSKLLDADTLQVRVVRSVRDSFGKPAVS